MIVITNTVRINEHEVQFEFIQASGPGGQNVNKVATAAKLRFDVVNSPSLSAPVKNKLLLLSRKRITSDGILYIDARRYRTQERNRQDALQRLIELIQKALYVPRPRKKTLPTKASQVRRLSAKKQRSVHKQNRQKGIAYDNE